MSFFNELKRRNVLRVGAAYAVVGWLVIQVVETVFPAFGFGDGAIRIVTIVFAIGFVPVLIFAWAFELTPEGLKKEKDVDRSQSITPQTGKKLDRMIMVVLALALGYFAFDKFVVEPQREASLKQENVAAVEEARQEGRSEALVESYGDKSIAVLAFDDMSQAGDQEYLSDGIAEELLNLLARIPDLRVISRSSAFSFKGKDLPLTEIAQQLNVAHILEGSVRKAGNRVRITAQLIEARSDTHLWSETYDRELDDIFAIQDDIAATVVDQLKITLLGEAPRVAETDPEAYALYLQAVHLRRQGTVDSFEQSNALLQQVLATNPHYAAAWERLGSNYMNLASVGAMPFDEGFALSREARERALEIDPGYAPAHAGLGWIALIHERDPKQSARHYGRALQLDPFNSRILSGSAHLLQALGRMDDALAIQEYVVTRDPVNPIAFLNLALCHEKHLQSDDAIASWETLIRLSPQYFGAHYGLGVALLQKGNAPAALEAMQKEPSDAWRMIGSAMAYHDLGEQELSDRALADLIGKYQREAPYNIAYVLAYRNEADRAFEWLDKAVEYGDPGLKDIAVEPLFRNIHSDPRWLPFLESIGMAPEQLAAIEFEVTLPGAKPD